MKRVLVGICSLASLCACSNTGGSASGLLASDGNFLIPLEDAVIGTANFAGTNNGYVFQVGLDDARSEFVTQAVLLDGTDLPSPATTGTAEMTAAYMLETFQFPVTDETGLTGTRVPMSGDMLLTVDFDNRILSGADNGLALNGTFDATGQLTGTTSLQDMTGELAGDVGNAQAVGIFNGQSVTGVFAGGFIAE